MGDDNKKKDKRAKPEDNQGGRRLPRPANHYKDLGFDMQGNILSDFHEYESGETRIKFSRY